MLVEQVLARGRTVEAEVSKKENNDEEITNEYDG
jgi:hypothetical protein